MDITLAADVVSRNHGPVWASRLCKLSWSWWEPHPDSINMRTWLGMAWRQLMWHFFEISPTALGQCETTEGFGFDISLQFFKGVLRLPILDITNIPLSVNVLISNEFPTSTLRLEGYVVVVDVDSINNGVKPSMLRFQVVRCPLEIRIIGSSCVCFSNDNSIPAIIYDYLLELGHRVSSWPILDALHVTFSSDVIAGNFSPTWSIRRCYICRSRRSSDPNSINVSAGFWVFWSKCILYMLKVASLSRSGPVLA